jgi:sugar O-acyltransferase (sialic acid O-acetyltransferase NeuD family)
MSQTRVPLLLLGASACAIDVTDLLSDLPQFEVAGYVVSVPPYEPGSTLLDRPIYWVDDIARFAATHAVACAIVTTKRYALVERIAEMGFRFVTIIHPTARVSRMATIGEGVIISSGAQVATHSEIGRHVFINRGALIGHHNIIGDYSTISPGANLAGHITVGRRVWVGLGANVLEKRTIGECSLVGAGSLVMKDVPPRTKVMGVPAVVIEKDFDGY